MLTSCADVKVPVENTLGKENEGLKVILSNFNHERLVMATGSCRAAREIVEQCFKWSSQRKVFGKPLIAQPVIRQHLAEMLQLVEAEQSWLENIVFQMTTMPSYAEQSDKLAGASTSSCTLAHLRQARSRCSSLSALATPARSPTKPSRSVVSSLAVRS